MVNFEPIIWGMATSAVQPTLVYFGIVLCFDILGSLIREK